jgi:hypothetical protein
MAEMHRERLDEAFGKNTRVREACANQKRRCLVEKVQPDDVEEAYGEAATISEIGVLQEEGKLVAVIVPKPFHNIPFSILSDPFVGRSTDLTIRFNIALRIGQRSTNVETTDLSSRVDLLIPRKPLSFLRARQTPGGAANPPPQ